MASIARLSALTGVLGAEQYRRQLEDLNRVFADGFEPQKRRAMWLAALRLAQRTRPRWAGYDLRCCA
jgi:hypothetical protein